MKTRLKHYVSNFSFAIKIIFAASPKCFLVKTFLSLISSLLPFVPLFLWKNLIDALTEFSQDDSQIILKNIIVLFISYCLIALLEKFVQAISKFLVYKYEDEINLYLDNLMVDKVSSVDLEFFDNSKLKDHLDNSWLLINSTQRQIKYVFDTIQGLVKLSISFITLITLSLWLIPIILLLCVPLVLFDKKKRMNIIKSKMIIRLLAEKSNIIEVFFRENCIRKSNFFS